MFRWRSSGLKFMFIKNQQFLNGYNSGTKAYVELLFERQKIVSTILPKMLLKLEKMNRYSFVCFKIFKAETTGIR